MNLTKEALLRVFGEDSSGTTPEECALRSNRKFVRSQDHLALATEQAKGRRLTAWQALDAFGFGKLSEALEYGSAVIVADPREPAATIRKRREILGISVRDVARAASISKSVAEKAEDPKEHISIQALEKIAQVLALDEARLSTKAEADDEGLAIRLRQFKNARPEFTPSAVLAFAEAAWVTKKQAVLATWLGKSSNLAKLGFETDSRYASHGYPAWQYGYDLAHSTRKNLGLKETDQIPSLRELVETVLKIPLIHLSLPRQFAGATISVGNVRGIAVNIEGLNQNVWVRRATIAHELGHLLWDPDQHLRSLLVDTFADLQDQPPQLKHDVVEARANAFAIELLAPREGALEIYNSHGGSEAGLRAVMEFFGVSFTSAKFQLWNALERKSTLDSFVVNDVEPTDDWKGRESFTNDFFKPKEVPLSRRGLFAWYVIEAMRQKLISIDSAASYLCCSQEELRINEQLIRDIYQDKTKTRQQ